MSAAPRKTHPLVAVIAACAAFGMLIPFVALVLPEGALQSGYVDPTGKGGETSQPTPAPSAAPLPAGVGCTAFRVASDPKARYCWSNITADQLTGKLTVTTRRLGPSGESWAVREVDCTSLTFRYIGEGDTLAAAKRRNTAGARMASITPGSISAETVIAACKAGFL
jgi:hypothetical protein